MTGMNDKMTGITEIMTKKKQNNACNDWITDRNVRNDRETIRSDRNV